MTKIKILPWLHAKYPFKDNKIISTHYRNDAPSKKEFIFGIRKEMWEHIASLPREVISISDTTTMINTTIKTDGRMLHLYIPNEYTEEIS